MDPSGLVIILVSTTGGPGTSTVSDMTMVQRRLKGATVLSAVFHVINEEIHPVHRDIVHGIGLHIHPLGVFHHVDRIGQRVGDLYRRGDIVHRDQDSGAFVGLIMFDSGELQGVETGKSAHVPELQRGVVHLVEVITADLRPVGRVEASPEFQAIQLEVRRVGAADDGHNIANVGIWRWATDGHGAGGHRRAVGVVVRCWWGR